MAKSDEHVNSTRGALQHYAENPKSVGGQRLTAINNWQQTVINNPDKFNEEEKGLMTSLAQETLKSVQKGERKVSQDPKEQEAYKSLVENTPKKQSFWDKARGKLNAGVEYAKGTGQFIVESYKEIGRDVKDTIRERKETMKEDRESIAAGMRAGKESVQETFDKVGNSQVGKAVARQANKAWMNVKYGMGFADKEEMNEKVWQPEERRAEIKSQWKESRKVARAAEGKESFADKVGNIWEDIKEAGGDAKDSFEAWNIERKQKNAEKKAQKEREKAEKEAKRAHRKDVIARWKESRAEAKRIAKEAKKKEKEAKKAQSKAKWSNRWKIAKKWLKRAGIAIVATAAAGAAIATAPAGLYVAGLLAAGYGAKKGVEMYKTNKQQKKAERAEFMRSNPKSRDEAIALVQQYQKDNSKSKEGNAFENLSPEQVTETWKQLGGKDERNNLNAQYNRNLDGMALAHKDAFFQMEHASENIMKKIASGEIQITKENAGKYAPWLAINKETAFGNYTDKDGNTASIKDRNAEIEAILKANGVELPKLNEDTVNKTQVEGQNRASEEQKQAEAQQKPAVENTDKTAETQAEEKNNQTQITPEKTAGQQIDEMRNLGIDITVAAKIYEDMTALKQFQKENPNDKEGIKALTESVGKNLEQNGIKGAKDFGYGLTAEQQVGVKKLYAEFFQPEGKPKTQETEQEKTAKTVELPKRSGKINGEELFQKLENLDKEHPLPDGSTRAERYGKALQEYQVIKKARDEKAAAGNLNNKLFKAGHTDKDGKSDFIGMPKELASEFKEYLGQQGIVDSFKPTKKKTQENSNSGEKAKIVSMVAANKRTAEK